MFVHPETMEQALELLTDLDAELALVRRNLLTTWNAACPPGTWIAVRIWRDGPEYESRTRGHAWALGDGTPVVLIEGRAGGWSLAFCRALRAGEQLEALPPPKEAAP